MRPNKFQAWLKLYGGADKLAKTLGVSRATAFAWQKQENWPRVKYILDIIGLSKGQLTAEDIILGTGGTGASRRFSKKKGN